jgi:hypothetical protein
MLTVLGNGGILIKGGDHLTMGHFDNLDNGLLNKYQKNLKNRKKVFIYVLLLID